MSRLTSMQSHLLAQFTDKSVLSAIFYAIAEEMDELDTVFYDLKYNRWIDTGSGEQLDGLGTIIDRSRKITDALTLSFFGFDNQPSTTGFGQSRFRSAGEPYLATLSLADPEYRSILWSKVHKNNCKGTAEDTITSLKYIFQSSLIILQDMYPAAFVVGIGRVLTDNEIQFAKATDVIVRCGGVECKWMEMFDADAFFGFETTPGAKGFGVGKLASIFLEN